MSGIDERDVRVDVWRSGARGPITMRLTHVPTGIVATKTGTGAASMRRRLMHSLSSRVALAQAQRAWAEPVDPVAYLTDLHGYSEAEQ